MYCLRLSYSHSAIRRRHDILFTDGLFYRRICVLPSPQPILLQYIYSAIQEFECRNTHHRIEKRGTDNNLQTSMRLALRIQAARHLLNQTYFRGSGKTENMTVDRSGTALWKV